MAASLSVLDKTRRTAGSQPALPAAPGLNEGAEDRRMLAVFAVMGRFSCIVVGNNYRDFADDR